MGRFLERAGNLMWWVIGTLAFLVFVTAFMLLTWWVLASRESELDDGDPNNPYHKGSRK
jgi:hypothetical protein